MTSWRSVLLAGSVGVAGCGTEGTGPTPPPPAPNPTGVIYMQAGQNTSDPLVSVRVDSGELMFPQVPPVLGGTTNFRLFDGAVSATTAIVGGAVLTVGKTFLWHVPEGGVTFHGDPFPTQENFHTWDAPGNVLAFRRRRIDGGASGLALVRLNAITGVQDTVIQLAPAPGRTFSQIRWVGGDSLLLDWREPGGPEYRIVSLQTGEMTQFTEVTHLGHSVPPSFSRSGRWMTLLTYRDSIGPSGEPIFLLSRRLRDRTTGDELEYESDLQSDLGAGSASTAFSSDERFLATCENDTTIAIRAIPGAGVSRRLTVPYCKALSWTVSDDL